MSDAKKVTVNSTVLSQPSVRIGAAEATEPIGRDVAIGTGGTLMSGLTDHPEDHGGTVQATTCPGTTPPPDPAAQEVEGIANASQPTVAAAVRMGPIPGPVPTATAVATATEPALAAAAAAPPLAPAPIVANAPAPPAAADFDSEATDEDSVPLDQLRTIPPSSTTQQQVSSPTNNSNPPPPPSEINEEGPSTETATKTSTAPRAPAKTKSTPKKKKPAASKKKSPAKKKQAAPMSVDVVGNKRKTPAPSTPPSKVCASLFISNGINVDSDNCLYASKTDESIAKCQRRGTNDE